MAFIESPRFPDDISYGSVFGPQFNTTVVISKSGFEKRNVNWTYGRMIADVSYAIRAQQQLDALLDFFHAAQGRAHGFRFKDFSDFRALGSDDPNSDAFDDLQFATGDGSTTIFQLVKNYTLGSETTSRTITKIVSGTLLIGVNGVESFDPADYSVDLNTGLVTFVVAPPAAQVVTWGGEFDTPVRFDNDEIAVELEAFKLGNASVKLMELRIT